MHPEPDEGEVTAAIRLLGKAQHRNWRYCDMICADALYAQAPFINAVSALGKWIIIKLKQDNYHLVRDMDGLMSISDGENLWRRMKARRRRLPDGDFADVFRRFQDS